MWIIRRILIVLCVSIFPKTVFSQTIWAESFSDSNFTTNPTWVGDTNQFIVNGAKTLQLNAPAVTSISQLTTASQASIEAAWEFSLTLDFNPSANNYARIYLMASAPNLKQNLQGYFVRVGGNSDDQVSLYRHDGATTIPLIESLPDLVDSDPVSIRIRVERDSLNKWQLFVDTSATNQFTLIGSATDGQYSNSAYFGILCDYTSTRSDKFFLDDIVVNGKTFVDFISPQLAESNFPSNQHIGLVFSEPIDSSTSVAKNFTLINSNAQPNSVRWSNAAPNQVELFFHQPFVNGDAIRLRIEGIEDLFGNEMADTILETSFYRPDYRSVVFNELMIDPNPPVGLPDIEYVELYNSSGQTINLSGWHYVADDDTLVLPEYSLLPGGFVLLVNSAGALAYDTLSTISLSLSSSYLNNTSEQLMLLDENKKILDAITYQSDWITNEAKQEGGWSLEQMNSNLPCSDILNWCASKHPDGGTPGKPNVPERDFHPGKTAIQSFLWWSDRVISVVFNRGLNNNQIPLINSTAEIDSVWFDGALPQQITLRFQNPITANPVSIFVEESEGCTGAFAADTITFSKPTQPKAGDVVLNEILFNPKPGSGDFIEIWNTTSNTYLLGDFRLGNTDEFGSPTNSYAFGHSKQILTPHSIYVVTSDTAGLCDYYSCAKPRFYHQADALPSMPDDAGRVALLSASLGVLEEVAYSDNWHHSILSNTEGVSLERINPRQPAGNALSWHSAASRVNYATPGRVNSQFNATNTTQGQFSLSTETLSPNNDGYHDVAFLSYQLPQGSLLSASVFGVNGVKQKTLVSNALAEPESSILWDGKDDNFQLVSSGIYIIFVEWHTLDGLKGVEKLTLAVSR